MDLVKNKIYRAKLLDYTTEGAAIARIGGIAVFVAGGAVGDQCDIRITKVNRHMAFGHIEKVIVPSASRITPLCSHAGACGGCCFQHITYAAELQAKRKKVEDALQRIGGFSMPISGIIGADSTEHYRNKAQFPVNQGKSGVVTGFYRPRSHDIVPIEHCLIQSEKTNLLAALVRRWMDEHKIMPYDERTETGLIRHVYVRVGSASGQILLTLVATAMHLPSQDALIDLLTTSVPSLVGILINYNRRPGNAILGNKTITLWGRDFLEDTLCGNNFRLSPHAFYQVNHAQTEKLYQCALDFANLDGTQTVIELYCGAGTITLAMARHAARVMAIEIVPEAIQNARENARRNKIMNVEFICADAGQAAFMLSERGECPDVLVVDPPRKGLDEVTLAAIIQLKPNRIVYISCDPATLARDMKLLHASKYDPICATAFDMFPRTAHVETCVLLSHKNPQTFPPSL